MQEEKEQQEVVKIQNKGRNADGYPCPPNKDKSEYADASPNCIYKVCMPRLFLIIRIFFMNTKYLIERGK